MEAVLDEYGVIIGVKVNMTTYSEEGITLMGGEIARLRKEVERLQANCDLRGLIIEDLQIQVRGLLETLELIGKQV